MLKQMLLVIKYWRQNDMLKYVMVFVFSLYIYFNYLFAYAFILILSINFVRIQLRSESRESAHFDSWRRAMSDQKLIFTASTFVRHVGVVFSIIHVRLSPPPLIFFLFINCVHGRYMISSQFCEAAIFDVSLIYANALFIPQNSEFRVAGNREYKTWLSEKHEDGEYYYKKFRTLVCH